MTSETPDVLYPIAVEEKAWNVWNRINQTLKRGKEECGNEAVLNLVKDSVDGAIKKEVLNNSLDILVQKQSVKRNKIGNRECLSLPKETLKVSHELLRSGQKFVDCSQATVESNQLIEDTESGQLTEDTSQATLETLCSDTFIQSDFEGVLNLKVELENLKLQIIAEIVFNLDQIIADLVFNEISSLKDPFSKSFVNKASANWLFIVSGTSNKSRSHRKK